MNYKKVQKEFLEHLNEDLSSNVVLIGPSGDQWQVTILKKGNNVYTKNGWSQFLKDNSVVLDEFLLFTYHEGNRFHQFNVQIFGGNGLERLCLKEEKNKLFTMNRSLVQKVNMMSQTYTLHDDRAQVNNPQSQLIHHAKGGPKIWQVYSRRGKKVNSG
ncbi:hypothetical protein JHK87_045065 [Glycine soja]|nr:hypothetical protein JHK87_045065 [Glycine soja]